MASVNDREGKRAIGIVPVLAQEREQSDQRTAVQENYGLERSDADVNGRPITAQPRIDARPVAVQDGFVRNKPRRIAKPL